MATELLPCGAVIQVAAAGRSVATLRIASSWIRCMMRRLMAMNASLVSVSTVRGRGNVDLHHLLDAAGSRRHHIDPVAEQDRLVDVVGDEQHGLVRCCQISSSSSCISDRVWLSSAPNGSSISRIAGSLASARASATRCIMPPESCFGYSRSNPFRPTWAMNRCAVSRRCAAGMPAIRGRTPHCPAR